jgi:pilus assembly protein CpaB
MKRPVAFVVLAGVAALVASVLVYSALKRREIEVQQAKATNIEIVVAAHDLPLGTKIDASSLRMARWSRDSVPPGAFTDINGAVGSFVKSEIVENDPLVPAKLFMGDKTAGVMPLLNTAGMRAMSVQVDEVSDIAGFDLPHAKVDVLVALSTIVNGNQKPYSKTVLQNIEVLAVAQEIQGKKDEPELVKVVTLLVTPQDAEKLALASHEGTLRLAMRNYGDDKIVMTAGSDVEGMLHSYSTVPVMAAQPSSDGHIAIAAHVKPAVQVEILRDGVKRQSVSFVKEAALGPTSAKGRSAKSDDTYSQVQTPDEQQSSDQAPGRNGPSLDPSNVDSSGPAHAQADTPAPAHDDIRAAFAPNAFAPNAFPNAKTIDVP